MTANDNSDKDRIIAEINQLYAKYDALFPNITTMDTERTITEQGMSILDDIEYYLHHPEYYIQFENLILQLLKKFSKSILSLPAV